MTVSTKDTTALSDAELAEMADLCVDREPNFDIGFLSKQREDWVLVTQVREGNKLRGYSFCTLERIGGTPSLLVGLLLVDRNAKSDQTLKAILHDQFRRALLAFPDEDVLLGSRLTSPDGFRAFAGLEDVVPRLGYKPTGEVDRRQDLHHDGVAGPGRRARLRRREGADPRRRRDLLQRPQAPQGRAPGGLRLGDGRVAGVGQTAQVVQPRGSSPVQLL
jgi:hypothetical protein